MATIRSLTAEKIYSIEAATVINAELRNGHLVLITHDGTEIDVGSVIGPVGPSGDHSTLANLDQDTHTQYLNRSGIRSMTGPLVLASDPTVALGAATKQYVHGRGASLRVTANVPSTATGQTRLVAAAGSFVSWGGVVQSGDALVCPVAGWYKFNICGGFASNTNGTIRLLSLGTDTDPTGATDAVGASPGPLGDVNIAAHTAEPVATTSGYGAPLSAFGIGYVPAAGTKVCIWARQDSGIALSGVARFSLELIRTS
jgi:hypothetical protein